MFPSHLVTRPDGVFIYFLFFVFLFSSLFCLGKDTHLDPKYLPFFCLGHLSCLSCSAHLSEGGGNWWELGGLEGVRGKSHPLAGAWASLGAEPLAPTESTWYRGPEMSWTQPTPKPSFCRRLKCRYSEANQWWQDPRNTNVLYALVFPVTWSANCYALMFGRHITVKEERHHDADKHICQHE